VNSNESFCGVKSYTFSRWGFDGTLEIRLDTSQINVLLIETVERNFRAIPQANYVNKITFSKRTSQSSYNKGISVIEAGLPITKEELMQFHKRIYNPDINQNLEFNLFDYLVFTPFKEMKAWLNLKLFNRVPQEISIIDNCPFLFLRETVDPSSDLSSFKSLPDKEVNDIVIRINNVYEYYKKKGFTEVFFSVIPNPVSMIAPGYKKYNDIIRRVQNHPYLNAPMINVIDYFKHDPAMMYNSSDSHWKVNGFYIWLNTFNRRLRTIVEK